MLLLYSAMPDHGAALLPSRLIVSDCYTRKEIVFVYSVQCETFVYIHSPTLDRRPSDHKTRGRFLKLRKRILCLNIDLYVKVFCSSVLTAFVQYAH